MSGEKKMCYSNPAKSLEIARSRLTPEQWAKFEREFNDFCVVQGFNAPHTRAEEWAKWAFFCAKPRPAPPELTDWYPCTTPPGRDGWYDIWRGAQLIEAGLVLASIPERVRFANGKWDRESCESKAGIWPSWDCWRGVKG
jgi:hypothetical protein